MTYLPLVITELDTLSPFDLIKLDDDVQRFALYAGIARFTKVVSQEGANAEGAWLLAKHEGGDTYIPFQCRHNPVVTRWLT